MTDPIRSALKRLLSAVLDGLGQDDHPMGWARVDDAIDAARAALAEPVAEGPTDEELADTYWDAWHKHLDRTNSVLHSVGLRAVLARWGNHSADVSRMVGQPAPVPVNERLPGASHFYFEFVISDADDCTQAGGIAPTYAQALSEGQHYLAQYQQDGPHTLELRRVEVLHPDALPEQRQAAPAPAEGEVAELVSWLLDEADQYDCIKQAPDVSRKLRRAADLLSQRHPAPVPVSERLPGPGDCDAEGRCWLWRTDGVDEFWELVVPLSNIHEFNLTAQWKYTHWLPATALPLPAGEVE